ncbi:hypothetical protein FJZ19_00565 [Candidatus Pacearchaeota archaeon]|nr:hypothetical protein [Candidatus Pacearchaeota archaeon]
MVRISEEKKNRIKSNILALLYEHFPKSFFTAEISREIARDEEFIKQLMHELQDKKLVNCIRKNPQGATYSRRCRWMLSTKAYDAYKLAI